MSGWFLIIKNLLINKVDKWIYYKLIEGGILLFLIVNLVVFSNMKYFKYKLIVGINLVNLFWCGFIIFKGIVNKVNNGIESGIVKCYCYCVIVLVVFILNRLNVGIVFNLWCWCLIFWFWICIL